MGASASPKHLLTKGTMPKTPRHALLRYVRELKHEGLATDVARRITPSWMKAIKPWWSESGRLIDEEIELLELRRLRDEAELLLLDALRLYENGVRPESREGELAFLSLRGQALLDRHAVLRHEFIRRIRREEMEAREMGELAFADALSRLLRETEGDRSERLAG
jgi:hypothetical protein